eukprot:1130264-Karenia_brevis.AAC.1
MAAAFSRYILHVASATGVWPLPHLLLPTLWHEAWHDLLSLGVAHPHCRQEATRELATLPA